MARATQQHAIVIVVAADDLQHTAPASTFFAALHDVKAWTILGEMERWTVCARCFRPYCGAVFMGASWAVKRRCKFGADWDMISVQVGTSSSEQTGPDCDGDMIAV